MLLLRSVEVISPLVIAFIALSSQEAMEILLIDLIVHGFEGALDHAIDDALVALSVGGTEDFCDTDRRALDLHELSGVTQELCFLDDRL